MKYIDADKLYEKVDALMAHYAKAEEEIEDYNDVELAIFYQGKWKMCSEIINLITSLQQEQPEGGSSEKPNDHQPEVELNEETIINEFRIIRDKCFNEGIEGWQREKLIARHFYELGKNSK